MPSVSVGVPNEVLLSLSQHIGAPATLTVEVGDEVKVGQKIAEANGRVSSPVHASVSGKVKKIEELMLFDGRTVSAVRIESDGLMSVADGICPPAVSDFDQFLDVVRESGLVGLGGAGFPTAVKLEALRSGKVDTLIINGAECEPYITCDTRTMLEDGEWIRKGVGQIRRFAPSLKCVIGIEKNKKQCIIHMKELFAGDDTVTVKALPDDYPQGAEKVIIYNTTGRVVPEGKLPADVGTIVMNVTSVAFLGKYFETGMPLVSRTVTVDGGAAAEPKNAILPIGTTLGEAISLCGGLSCEVGKVIVGGPMMGNTAQSLDDPITKTTGAITLFDKKQSSDKKTTACIHCGRCVESCPHMLDPVGFSRALDIFDKNERMERLEKMKVTLCIECGCCSYVCPANRPLVQNNRRAKAELREHRAHTAQLKG